MHFCFWDCLIEAPYLKHNILWSQYSLIPIFFDEKCETEVQENTSLKTGNIKRITGILYLKERASKNKWGRKRRLIGESSTAEASWSNEVSSTDVQKGWLHDNHQLILFNSLSSSFWLTNGGSIRPICFKFKCWLQLKLFSQCLLESLPTRLWTVDLTVVV